MSLLQKHVSVKLVKAFVQPDGSYGNGAGVVLLPGISHAETELGNSREPKTCNHRFPSRSECIKIARQVGLPETSFVLFPQKNGLASCENRSILDDERGRKDSDYVGDGSKEKADFHVKWYTPECEVDMCGHATVALAGYIHSIIKGRAGTDISVNSDAETRQQSGYSWIMQCKAGLLGIEVVEGARKSIAAADHSNSNNAQKRESNQRKKYALDCLPRVVMEQALPEYCGIIDRKEIAASLSIRVNDLAIAVTDGNEDEDTRSNSESIKQVFPFSHCEIVSTGGRDLMIPVRSTVLNEMDILDNGKHNGSSDDIKRQQLYHGINNVSKRYNIVGYHMFEVDDSLFRSKRDAESENVPPVGLKSTSQSTRKDVNIEGQNTNDGRPIHLNELIRIFQMAVKKGNSGVESCLEAVGIEQEPWKDHGEINPKKSQHDDIDRDTKTSSVPVIQKSRTILVTGVRNFAPAVGIPEEPATGSANGALACYFVKHFFLVGSHRSNCSDSYSPMHRSNGLSFDNPVCFQFSMEQGRAMGEPCLIDAEIEVVNSTIRTVKVGGLVNVTGDSMDLDLTLI